MSPLWNRARQAAAQLEVVDTTALRRRMLAAVEEAIDHAEELLQDAPDVAQARRRAVQGVRGSRVVEAAGPLLAAGAPIAARAVRAHLSARTARRAAALAPYALRAHPAMLGAAVVGGVALGVELVRRQATDDADVVEGQAQDASPFDDEVADLPGQQAPGTATATA